MVHGVDELAAVLGGLAVRPAARGPAAPADPVRVRLVDGAADPVAGQLVGAGRARRGRHRSTAILGAPAEDVEVTELGDGADAGRDRGLVATAGGERDQRCRTETGAQHASSGGFALLIGPRRLHRARLRPTRTARLPPRVRRVGRRRDVTGFGHARPDTHGRAGSRHAGDRQGGVPLRAHRGGGPRRRTPPRPRGRALRDPGLRPDPGPARRAGRPVALLLHPVRGRAAAWRTCPRSPSTVCSRTPPTRPRTSRWCWCTGEARRAPGCSPSCASWPPSPR